MFSHIAAAQINPTVGDIAGNLQKIIHAASAAKAQGAEVVVFAELCLTGYPPEDLALMPAFQQAAMRALRELALLTAKTLPGILIGSIGVENGAVYNAIYLLQNGCITHTQYKYVLPNYGVFDEKRIFSAGGIPAPIMLQGIPTGLLICEDAWHPQLSAQLKAQGAERLIVINASPFEAGKLKHRHELIRQTAHKHQLAILYVNLIGGQDDIIFDGASFACDPQGNITWQSPQFEEEVDTVHAQPVRAVMPDLEQCWRAAQLGLKDYVRKNHFPGVLLGLSGGIDSAVTATMATDALGANKVLGVLLPSAYTSSHSMEDAHESARLLGIECVTLPIGGCMEATEAVLYPALTTLGLQGKDWRQNIAVGGNLQARLRAVLLMGISNATGFMLLNTSNKSEIAMGFSTLYGDACGGYAPLKDIYKTEIYALAAWRNAVNTPVIPERSITKPPSAELKPGQKDEDELPPYPILDPILRLLVDGRACAQDAIAAGYDAKIVSKVSRMLKISEYKRRQSPPGAKVSSMQFGRDRRYPLTNGFLTNG